MGVDGGLRGLMNEGGAGFRGVVCPGNGPVGVPVGISGFVKGPFLSRRMLPCAGSVCVRSVEGRLIRGCGGRVSGCKSNTIASRVRSFAGEFGGLDGGGLNNVGSGGNCLADGLRGFAPGGIVGDGRVAASRVTFPVMTGKMPLCPGAKSCVFPAGGMMRGPVCRGNNICCTSGTSVTGLGRGGVGFECMWGSGV